MQYQEIIAPQQSALRVDFLGTKSRPIHSLVVIGLTDRYNTNQTKQSLTKPVKNKIKKTQKLSTTNFTNRSKLCDAKKWVKNQAKNCSPGQLHAPIKRTVQIGLCAVVTGCNSSCLVTTQSTDGNQNFLMSLENIPWYSHEMQLKSTIPLKSPAANASAAD